MKIIRIMIDFLALIGLAFLFYGTYQISPPFAFIVVGSIMLLIALFSAFVIPRIGDNEPEEK